MDADITIILSQKFIKDSKTPYIISDAIFSMNTGLNTTNIEHIEDMIKEKGQVIKYRIVEDKIKEKKYKKSIYDFFRRNKEFDKVLKQ